MTRFEGAAHLRRRRRNPIEGRRLTCMSLAAIAVWSVTGCQDRQPLESSAEGGGIRGMVVGAAARSLDANGRFVLTAVGPTTRRPQIDKATALALADGFIRDLAPGLLPALQDEHRGAINLKALKKCDRVFYAESPYGELPDSLPAVYHRTHGPWWLVTFCAGIEPAVSIAVSAYDTHLSLKNGHLVYPPDQVQGQEFWAFGIPRDRHGALPLPPEEAVRLVSQLTGRPVIEPPTLIAPTVESGPPQTARWSVRLDQPVRLQNADGARSVVTDQVFASVSKFKEPAYLEVAAANQPATRSISWTSTARFAVWSAEARKGKQAHAPPRSIAAVARRATIPTTFERISGRAGK